jgi:NTE family protein
MALTLSRPPALNADLVLEGGGVKGLALVGAIEVLEEHGYRFRRIAGTSAGAIVGALVAAGMPAARRLDVMRSLDYPAFCDPTFLSRFGAPGKALSVAVRQGIYRGDHFRQWLAYQLRDLGRPTFGDLRLPEDPGSDLPGERRYGLVVMASDISRGELIRLPWDYARYGTPADSVGVADAVRASMSIPLFYRPVRLKDRRQKGPSWLVDGGLLSNFPVDAFDRTDGLPPRWPTFGLKLASRPVIDSVCHRVNGTIGLIEAMAHTATEAHDRMALDDPQVLARTIFIDTLGVKTTDFHIQPETQEALRQSGRAAAERFLQAWDFDAYVDGLRAAPVTASPATCEPEAA